MTGDQTIIRQSSGGNLVFETPDGNFRMTTDDIRNVLFHGRRVLLARADGIVDSDAMVHAVRTGFRGARRIILTVANRSFSTSDLSFIAVAKGKWAAVSMLPEQKGVADHVA
jgi:hypothetical protein